MREFLTKNIGLKITAILIAIILWFFITSRSQSEIQIEAPLELKNIPVGLETLSQTITSVDITVRGQESRLKSLKSLSAVRVYLDLSSAKKGKETYTLNNKNVKLPNSVALIKINPSTVTVVMEETVTKNVSVQPVVAGSPKKGFALIGIAVNPMRVNIKGSKTAIEKIQSIKTERIDIENAENNISKNIALNMPANIKSEASQIHVRITIKKKKEEK